ncbi:Light-mediated development protein DET1, partial [Cucurbita argyrosperma subsp. argyrosperma]
MYRSNNVAARIFDRQIVTPPPGTSFHCVRRFYENIVPNHTVYDVECPDHSFRKFTVDGEYLITFSRNHRDLNVYRPKWLSFSYKGDEIDTFLDFPSNAQKFESFFNLIYSVSLASCNELICKDFFIYMESNRFGLFATSTAQIQDAPAVGGAVPGIPSIEKITFHLLRLEDGEILDAKVFVNDFVNLAHNTGVFLYDDLLAIVSVRYQIIHILQIRDSGHLVDVRALGAFCREDDELFLHSSTQASNIMVHASSVLSRGASCISCMYLFWIVHYVGVAERSRLLASDVENGYHHSPSNDNSFLNGLKQRLLSFIFGRIWNEETDHRLRVQCLTKNFYFHFQDYIDLIIWKVQFLDRQHLLLKLGSVDGWVSRMADHHRAFFAVYDMETTEIVAFFQNSTDDICVLFERFCNHFHAASRNSLCLNFISSHSNNIHAQEQLRSLKNKAVSYSQFVKKMLVSLPFNCQSQSPSPYFDLSLFRYDEKVSPEGGITDGRTKGVSSFLFHPFLPLVLSIQQTTYLLPSVVNIHFR